MPLSNSSAPAIGVSLIRGPLAALTAACLLQGVAVAATLPASPQTFDSSYAAPHGQTWNVAAGDDLQATLNKAQLGDTIVLQAGASWTGPFTLPNKTSGSGWIYVISSQLANLPPPGTRVSPANAVNMPKILAPKGLNAIVTVANSHHYRFAGIEFATVSGAAPVYQVVVIGNGDTSPATLPHHIIFDRCYVHGDPTANHRRGIEIDAAYLAVIDSHISDFQEAGADSQGLWGYNSTGPIQIRNNFIEAAGENVMFGGADSRAATLVPSDIEIRNNHFFKPLSLIPSQFTVKNLLEFKATKRAVVTGNIFENSPAKSQNGFALLITPRNQSGTAPWTVVSDIAVVGNTFINVGSGFQFLGSDAPNPSQLTERVLVRNNVFGVTGLNGANGRVFQFSGGGSDYTIDHNTIIDTSGPPLSSASCVGMAESTNKKITNLVFTNNLSTRTDYGFFGSGVGQGTPALTANFSNWTFSKNVLVDAPGNIYPPGNFFPSGVASVRFMNYAGGNYALGGDSPYKNAGTDGADIGATGGAPVVSNTIVPNPPANVVVK
jgi:hypothetical protein